MQPDLRATLRSLAAGTAPWPLTIWGAPGRGKTCAALAFVDQVAGLQPMDRFGLKPRATIFETAPEFCQLVLDAKFGRLPDCGWKDFRASVFNSAIVVIDELDRIESPTDTRVESLLELMDWRHGRPLILISNSSPDACGRIYGARMPSRMSEGVIVQATGPDRRATKS